MIWAQKELHEKGNQQKITILLVYWTKKEHHLVNRNRPLLGSNCFSCTCSVDKSTKNV